MQSIVSESDFERLISSHSKAWCLIYKSGSEQSDCAQQSMKALSQQASNENIGCIDVNQLNTIHKRFSITTAPSLLEFENGGLKNIIKGCQTSDFYKNLLEQRLYKTESKGENIVQKRVTVYSTPSCSWCTTLKKHLNLNGIRYTEIDVSKDQNAAQAMVQKSGQQGVPQTEINGEMIIGFDKKRINELLNIN